MHKTNEIQNRKMEGENGRKETVCQHQACDEKDVEL